MGSGHSKDEASGDTSSTVSAETLGLGRLECDDVSDPIDGATKPSLNILYITLLSEFEDAVNDKMGWAWSQFDATEGVIRLHDILLRLRHWGNDITCPPSSSNMGKVSYPSDQIAEHNNSIITLDQVELHQEFLSDVVRSYMEEILEDLRGLRASRKSTWYGEGLPEAILGDLEASTKNLTLQSRPLRKFSELMHSSESALDEPIETLKSRESNDARLESHESPQFRNQEPSDTTEFRTSLTTQPIPDFVLSISENERLVEVEYEDPRVEHKAATRSAIEVKGHKTVGETLRTFAVHPVNDLTSVFWPERLLRKILTKSLISDALQALDEKVLADTILSDTESLEKEYLKIFATLALMGQEICIRDFIEERVSDRDLPLVLYEGEEESEKFMLAPTGAPDQPLNFMRDWKLEGRQQFLELHHSVNVPFLDFAPDRKSITHMDFPSGTVMPWITSTVVAMGGYASIHKVYIHPDCRGFHHIPSVTTGDCFAVKMLSGPKNKKASSPPVSFQEERDILELFNGFTHPHLVTLLTTWTLEGNWYLMFPYAKYDLDSYWMEPSNWDFVDPETGRLEIDSTRWISKQILGLTDALDSLHDARQLHGNQHKIYGRHGDVKPENILWFRCPSDHKGILVLTDFGLSSYESVRDRLARPADGIPFTPNYRPPECDMQNGMVSQSSDIWQLGCVLLEFVCWALGGPKLRAEFERQRESLSVMGFLTLTFFEVRVSTDGQYLFQAKDSVTKHVQELLAHPHCTSYFARLLALIENEMLVPDQAQRMTSRELLAQLRYLHQDVDIDHMAGESQKDAYNPRLRLHAVLKARLNKVNVSRIMKARADLSLTT